jgi:hypothetical protein
MNERIGKLAEQAGLLGPRSRVGNSHDATERFAELIVRECMKVSNRSLSKYELPSDKIAEHFGVEL